MPQQVLSPEALKAFTDLSDDEKINALQSMSPGTKALLLGALKGQPVSRGASGSFEYPTATEQFQIDHPYLSYPVTALARFGKSAVDTASGAVQGLYEAGKTAASYPNEPLFGAAAGAKQLFLDPQLALARKANEAQTRPEQAAYRAASAIPILGPALAHLGETLGTQGIPEALGEAAAYALAPDITSEGGGALGAAPRAVINALTSPDNLMMRAAELKTPPTPGWISKMADTIAQKAIGVMPAKATTNAFRAARAAAYERIATWAASGDAPKQFANPPTPEAFDTGAPPPEPFFPGKTGRRPAAQINNPPSYTPENLPPTPPEAPRTPALYRPGINAQDTAAWLESLRNAPKVPENPFKAIEEAIAPSGRYAKQAMQLTDVTGTPTKYGRQLISEVPEIVGKAKGPEFDTALMQGFDRAGKRIAQVEDSIPESTTVDRQPIVDKLKDLSSEYDETANPKTAAILERLIKTWEEKPAAIPWKEFLQSKRAFFREVNTRSIPMRKAYSILMDASGEVSPALSEANKSYSVIRRALDNANIDIKTGRRIMEVGKPPKQ